MTDSYGNKVGDIIYKKKGGYISGQIQETTANGMQSTMIVEWENKKVEKIFSNNVCGPNTEMGGLPI